MVKYTLEEFNRLINAVEAIGGHMHDELHSSTIAAKLTGDQGAKNITILNCGNQTLFTVPYVSFLNAEEKREIKVCAIDDMMGYWPRFKDAKADGKSIPW